MAQYTRGKNVVRVVSEHPLRAHSPWGSGTGAGGVAEEAPAGPSPPPSSPLCWTHPEWSRAFPWLVQGTTGRGPGEGAGDFRLFSSEGRPGEDGNWMALARDHGFGGVRHARQVHGAGILSHGSATTGLCLGPDADGHVSSRPGVLMGVTIADCVPVFLVDPERRTGAILHAGWRGTVAGILEEGVARLAGEFRADPEKLRLHLGPSICGSCYEVGPEVHSALGLPDPGGPAPVDLRGVLVERALGMGLLEGHVTRSSFCTRCNGSPFFSHRAGDPQRQVAYLGIRPS